MIRLIIGIILVSLLAHPFFQPKSERYLRDRVIKLEGDAGLCSGVQVRAPSGKDYVLSAGHCADLAKNGIMHATTEDGKKFDLKFLAEDDKSDLIVLEGVPKLRGISIAKYVNIGQHLITLTHGGGMDTYRTQGEVIQYKETKVVLNPIENEAGYKKCTSKPKTKLVDVDMWGIKIPVCILDTNQMVTTAPVIPGSSGGPAFDDSGDLVGIVSASHSIFSTFVSLLDIKAFLASY